MPNGSVSNVTAYRVESGLLRESLPGDEEQAVIKRNESYSPTLVGFSGSNGSHWPSDESRSGSELSLDGIADDFRCPSPVQSVLEKAVGDLSFGDILRLYIFDSKGDIKSLNEAKILYSELRNSINSDHRSSPQGAVPILMDSTFFQRVARDKKVQDLFHKIHLLNAAFEDASFESKIDGFLKNKSFVQNKPTITPHPSAMHLLDAKQQKIFRDIVKHLGEGKYQEAFVKLNDIDLDTYNVDDQARLFTFDRKNYVLWAADFDGWFAGDTEKAKVMLSSFTDRIGVLREHNIKTDLRQEGAVWNKIEAHLDQFFLNESAEMNIEKFEKYLLDKYNETQEVMDQRAWLTVAYLSEVKKNRAETVLNRFIISQASDAEIAVTTQSVLKSLGFESAKVMVLAETAQDLDAFVAKNGMAEKFFESKKDQLHKDCQDLFERLLKDAQEQNKPLTQEQVSLELAEMIKKNNYVLRLLAGCSDTTKMDGAYASMLNLIDTNSKARELWSGKILDVIKSVFSQYSDQVGFEFESLDKEIICKQAYEVLLGMGNNKGRLFFPSYNASNYVRQVLDHSKYLEGMDNKESSVTVQGGHNNEILLTIPADREAIKTVLGFKNATDKQIEAVAQFREAFDRPYAVFTMIWSKVMGPLANRPTTRAAGKAPDIDGTRAIARIMLEEILACDYAYEVGLSAIQDEFNKEQWFEFKNNPLFQKMIDARNESTYILDPEILRAFLLKILDSEKAKPILSDLLYQYQESHPEDAYAMDLDLIKSTLLANFELMLAELQKNIEENDKILDVSEEVKVARGKKKLAHEAILKSFTESDSESEKGIRLLRVLTAFREGVGI